MVRDIIFFPLGELAYYILNIQFHSEHLSFIKENYLFIAINKHLR